MISPEEVLAFWLDECTPEDWYKSDAAFDARIKDKFLPSWQLAAQGSLGLWLTYPSGTLAYIILTDQFSRNMFRDTGQAFASDHLARAAAKMAIDRKWDLRIDEPARQFFYMPLMHAENLCDQDRAVRLIHTRMPESGAMTAPHAQAHRQIIRDFGRFPFRNKALSRRTTELEQGFLDAGGYGPVITEIQESNNLTDVSKAS